MSDFSATRALFQLPPGVVYLGGNSLGPPPLAALERLRHCAEHEWADQLIGAWNGAGWMAQPQQLGDRIGALIGAPPGSVVLGDTLSIKVFQALSAALALVPERRVVLSDSGNFPTDLYMAQGLLRHLDRDLQLRVVAPEAVAAAIDESVAVLLLTEVDYRSGRRHDMAALSERARAHGVITVWDLAHSAGALPVDLSAAGADFAAGCSYKYLNGGPGAPAFIYVAPRHAERVEPILAGWLGHDAPFAFEPDYRPGGGVARMRVGTPPVLQMAALAAALDCWEGVDMTALRERSITLCERLIAGVASRCPSLRLLSPRDPAQRGSQVSFAFDQGYAAMQALIARGVIGDFRAPDIMRFGIAPLYIDEADIDCAIEALAAVIDGREYEREAFQRRGAVT